MLILVQMIHCTVVSKEVKNVCVMAQRTMPKEIYDDVAQLKVLISHLPPYPTMGINYFLKEHFQFQLTTF